LYALFWVIPWCLNSICQRFGTLFHIHGQVGPSAPNCLWRWNSVPKRRHIKFRRRGITQKKANNVQNTVKVWNQETWISSTVFLKTLNMKIDYGNNNTQARIFVMMMIMPLMMYDGSKQYFPWKYAMVCSSDSSDMNH
jgi:hypothetical protein